MDKFLKPIELAEVASTPSAPSSGNRKIYAKSNGKFYQLDSNGIETEMTASGAGGGGGGITSAQALAIISLRL